MTEFAFKVKTCKNLIDAILVTPYDGNFLIFCYASLTHRHLQMPAKIQAHFETESPPKLYAIKIVLSFAIGMENIWLLTLAAKIPSVGPTCSIANKDLGLWNWQEGVLGLKMDKYMGHLPAVKNEEKHAYSQLGRQEINK